MRGQARGVGSRCRKTYKEFSPQAGTGMLFFVQASPLVEQYDVDAETCQREVRAFVEQLINARLLETVPA